MKQIKFYRQYNILDSFNEKILNVMDLFTKKLNFHKNSVVVEFDSQVEGIYLIEEGAVKVSGNVPSLPRIDFRQARARKNQGRASWAQILCQAVDDSPE